MQEPEISVSVADQRLDLIENGRVVWSAKVSTSSRGTGSEPGSYKTPTGRFFIAEMHGGGAPAWERFESRVPTGELGDPGSPDDQILSRILWLAGAEPGNANTYSRYIYIHGTNHESLLGTPASHGCIRMANADVIELFERVRPGTPIRIA